MINIDNKYSVKRDAHCWNLIERREGINPKTKQPTITERITFHPTLEKLVRKLIDIEAGNCNNMEQIIELLQTKPSEIAKKIEVNK